MKWWSVSLKRSSSCCEFLPNCTSISRYLAGVARSASTTNDDRVAVVAYPLYERRIFPARKVMKGTNCSRLPWFKWRSSTNSCYALIARLTSNQKLETPAELTVSSATSYYAAVIDAVNRIRATWWDVADWKRRAPAMEMKAEQVDGKR